MNRFKSVCSILVCCFATTGCANDEGSQLPTFCPPSPAQDEAYGVSICLEYEPLDEEVEDEDELELADSPEPEADDPEELIQDEDLLNLSNSVKPTLACVLCDDYRGTPCTPPATKQCWEDDWSHPYCFGEDQLYCGSDNTWH